MKSTQVFVHSDRWVHQINKRQSDHQRSMRLILMLDKCPYHIPSHTVRAYDVIWALIKKKKNKMWKLEKENIFLNEAISYPSLELLFHFAFLCSFRVNLSWGKCRGKIAFRIVEMKILAKTLRRNLKKLLIILQSKNSPQGNSFTLYIFSTFITRA